MTPRSAPVSNHLSASVALARAPAVLAKVNAPDAAASCRDISPVQNVTAFRRSFPDRWAEYLRETYRTAYGVQKAFPGIDSKTARAWIKGDHGPSGGFVAAVVKADPNAMEILGRTA